MRIEILLLLCLVQGLTEFLPISSSGHLLLIEKIFNIETDIILINLFLHLATLFAVIIYYRKIILKIIKQPFQPLTFKLLISTIITAIIAFLYELFDLSLVFNEYFGYYFIITGILLLFTYYYQKKSIVINENNISYKNATIVGLVQGIAILPGISRSGSTISTLIILGNDEVKSAEYSFLLSIPIIVGGFIFELIKINNFKNIFSEVNYYYVIISFIFTFLISLFSLKITTKLLKRNKYVYFSIYLILIGIIVNIFL